MMRYLFLTLLGFFGPALLMLLIRLMWFRIRNQLKKDEPEIIDVTPIHKHRPSRLFILSWLLISVLCTGLLIWHLDDDPAASHIYIPAHINADGQFIPAQTINKQTTENKADK